MNFSIKKILRDPFWGSIAVLVAVIIFFISQASYTPASELSIIHSRTVVFNDPLLPENRIKLLVEGLPKDINNVDVSYFRIRNSSENPIKPENIIAPLSVKKGDGIKRILLVESCSDKLAQQCSSDSSESRSSPFIALSWTEQSKGEEWHASSELMNPKEEACVLLVSERDPSVKKSILDRFSWTARIENIKIKVYSSFNNYGKENISSQEDIFRYISVLLVGADIYWFFALFAVLFSVVYYLSILSGWISTGDYQAIAKALLVSVLAISTSEILVNIFMQKRMSEELHVFVFPLLIIHIGLVIYLLIKILKNRRNKST